MMPTSEPDHCSMRERARGFLGSSSGAGLSLQVHVVELRPESTGNVPLLRADSGTRCSQCSEPDTDRLCRSAGWTGSLSESHGEASPSPVYGARLLSGFGS